MDQIIKMLVFLIVLFVGVSKADERKAVLNLETEHVLSNEHPNVGDSITFMCNLSHISTSKLEAVNLTIFITVPNLITFDKVVEQGTPLQSDVLQNGIIQLQLPNLPPKDSIAFKIETHIAKEIGIGQHHIVTVFETNYQSMLIDNTITDIFARYLSYSHVSLVGKGCDSPLGMGSGNIKDYQITASTFDNLKPKQARYGDATSDAWCSKSDDQKPYIQLAFAHKTRVTSISTWGRKFKNFYVKSYSISYSYDEENWIFYTEDGLPKEFIANESNNKEKKQFVDELTANFIRIHPITWELFACLRLELYGCQVTNIRNGIDPIGMEDGRIPPSSLSQSPKSTSNTEYARLNKNVASFPYGWMADPAEGEWLQIDLNSLHKVCMVSVMGGTVTSFYVITFYLQYSNNSLAWSTLKSGDGSEKLLQGPSSSSDASEPFFIPIVPSVKARIFRFIPKDFKISKVMRVELYGSMIEENFKYKETPTSVSRRGVLVDEQRNKLYICSLTSQKKMSSCKRSNDGYTWTALPSAVDALLSLRTDTGRIFGMDRKLNIVMSDDFGVTWYSISKNEWQYQTSKFSITKLTSIDDILGMTEPTSNLTWSLSNGTVWGVSGQGWHKKPSASAGSWTLSALWSCCGQ